MDQSMPHRSSEILKYQSNGLAWMTFTSRALSLTEDCSCGTKTRLTWKGSEERESWGFMFVGFLVDFLVRRLVGYAAFSRFPDLRHAALGQQTFQKNKPINKLSKKWKTSRSTINTAAHASYIAQKMFQNLSTQCCIAAAVKTLRCVKRFHGKSMIRAPLAP